MTRTQASISWIALVDSRRGQLLRCNLTPAGSRHLESIDHVESQWQGQQHGRPSPRLGKTGNTYASPGHETEEDMERFARQLVKWMQQLVKLHQIERLTVFAPPRSLGAIRPLIRNPMRQTLDLQEGDLLNMPHRELIDHKAIRELVD